MKRKAGSQLIAEENLGYEMDSFLQQIFISRGLCMPTFALGTWDEMVNRQSLGSPSLHVQCQSAPPQKSSAKPVLPADALDELKGGDAVLFQLK